MAAGRCGLCSFHQVGCQQRLSWRLYFLLIYFNALKESFAAIVFSAVPGAAQFPLRPRCWLCHYRHSGPSAHYRKM